MGSPPIMEVIAATLVRLTREDPLGFKQEAIEVQTSRWHTQTIGAWTSASWALDTDGNLYGRGLSSEEGRVRGPWEPVILPDNLDKDTYNHICSGLMIAGEP